MTYANSAELELLKQGEFKEPVADQVLHFLCEHLKLDIPEGFESAAARTAIIATEIETLQGFALNVRRAIDTCRDDQDFNGLVERIQDLTDKLQDNLNGDSMVEEVAQ